MTNARAPGPRDGDAVATGRQGDTPRKWALLSLLVEAREAFGLKPRQLDVLRGLLTFLPSGGPDAGGAIVFPSNRALCNRLNGMPESTLRRHLARLVDAEIVTRRDSPSGKRYRVGRAADLVFGFDLGPFFAMATSLARAADGARARRRALAEARARLRGTLVRRTGEDLRAALRLVRRRGASLAEIEAATAVGTEPDVQAPSDAEPPKTDDPAARIARAPEHERRRKRKGEDVQDLVSILESWTGATIRDVTALKRAGRSTFAGAGLSAEAWRHASDRHGATWASLAVACILRRGSAIRRPDAYLAALVRRAATGTFVIDAALPS